MIELIYSPTWFYGKDIIIDIISVIVLLLIAYFSLKYYNMNKKNKNYLFFSTSFGLIALSFIFKIITNFTLYFISVETTNIGLFTLTYNSVHSSNILFTMGFLIYRVLTLLGLFILYSIYSKPKLINFILIIYLIILSSYFTRSIYYLFHLTSLILLLGIIVQYLNNYKKNHKNASKWLIYSFLLIALSQIIFVFVGINSLFYVFAEGIQLLGYVALLITFIKVLLDGKKKRKK
jgi:hypothetical protein